ncbi:hypothetical protein [Streptomyces monashensis]|uniref:Uncharacterized protein n=1 Tax=Streptomyces monashensis TaxID=1678012 RepID=A0A1S2QKL2_9ACTN|nr:hypothetical protein [Streptomyces monashensis]OIK06710.1 hypothetical protein BIV23_06900 [Streptomyces monashensis]
MKPPNLDTLFDTPAERRGDAVVHLGRPSEISSQPEVRYGIGQLARLAEASARPGPARLHGRRALHTLLTRLNAAVLVTDARTRRPLGVRGAI